MIPTIDIRFLTVNNSEINMIRNLCYERMGRNNGRIIELTTEYFDRAITLEMMEYNTDKLERENSQLQHMIDYLDNVQYGKDFDDHESVEYDED